MVIWPYGENRQTAVIELKIKHGNLDAVIKQGIEQTTQYMDRANTDEGYLVIFDRTPGKKWEEKIFRKTEEYQGRTIIVWGM